MYPLIEIKTVPIVHIHLIQRSLQLFAQSIQAFLIASLGEIAVFRIIFVSLRAVGIVVHRQKTQHKIACIGGSSSGGASGVLSLYFRG